MSVLSAVYVSHYRPIRPARPCLLLAVRSVSLTASHLTNFSPYSLNSPFFRCEKCDKRFEVAKGIYNHILMSDKEHPDFEKEWQGWMDAHPQYDYRGLGIMLTT